MESVSVREASHAGSWYTDHGPTLTSQLQGWLDDAEKDMAQLGKVPRPGARIIIAPHAGYAYSGPAAAWAYRMLDVSKAKRVFLLGPSHHLYLPGCALSKHTHYATPNGNLPLDQATIETLHRTEQFKYLSASSDSSEHSLEMHLPYIHHLLSMSFKGEECPPLVPILVGSTNPATEKEFGALLAPYVADPANIFIISSDFCHWGSRFSYTYYLPASTTDPSEGMSLRSKDRPRDPPIHESIARLDKLAMRAIENGQHAGFLATLRDTGNTVCGRHPIGVIMAAIEILKSYEKPAGDSNQGKFHFIRYERSGDVVEGKDSSVSYASAFALL